MRIKNKTKRILIFITLIIVGIQVYISFFHYNYIKLAVIYSEPYSKNEVEKIINIAKCDIENYFQERGFKYKLNIYILNCSLFDDINDIIVKLNKERINLVIGFDYSYQIEKIFNLVENNDIIVLSPNSSSDVLCIEKKHIFRLKTSDSYQGYVISKIIQYENKKAIIITHLNTTWSNNISQKIINYLNNKNIIISNIIYNNSTDYTINQIESCISNFRKNFNESQIAIVNIGIFDTIDIITKLNNTSLATNVLWIGSDALMSKMILQEYETTINMIFSKVSLICVAQTPIKSDQYIKINNQFKKIFDSDMDFIQCARYDACWIFANSIYLSNSIDVNDILQYIPLVSKSYSGLTGNYVFDNFNDRKYSNYSIYRYNKDKNEIKIIGYFDAEEDRIILFHSISTSSFIK